MAADTPLSEAGPGHAVAGDPFGRFADFVPLMMWRTDTRGHAVHHNESWLAFTGRDAAEERGRGWRRGLHPDDEAAHASAFETALAALSPRGLDPADRGRGRPVVDVELQIVG